MTLQLRFILLFTPLLLSTMIYAQEKSIPLWGNATPPYSKPHQLQETEEVNDWKVWVVKNVTTPVMKHFPPPPNKSIGVAVVICPGGAYTVEAFDHEGNAVARKLNEWGIDAFVLRYRLPNDSAMTNKQWVPLIDALQAIRLVRQNARQWGIQSDKIGIMGFSAGGHLAASASTLYDRRVEDGLQPADVRPDFSILVYPVISMQENLTHGWSRQMLLGHDPDYTRVCQFSTELQVNEKTPPAFIVHSADDDGVPLENSLRYTAAMQQHHVPVELHVFPSGGHGYGMAENNPVAGQWVALMKEWLLRR